MSYFPTVGGPVPPAINVPEWRVPALNTSNNDLAVGDVCAFDLSSTTTGTTTVAENLYHVRRPASGAGVAIFGIYGIVTKAMAGPGGVGEVVIRGRVRASVGSSATGTTSAGPNTRLYVLTNTGASVGYLDAVPPTTGTNATAALAHGRVSPAILLETASPINNGAQATPLLAEVLFDGFMVQDHWRPARIEHVADGATVNQLLTAMRAAGVIATAAT